MRAWRGTCAAVIGLTVTVTGCTVDRAGGQAATEVTTLTFAQPNDSEPPPQLAAWADQVDRLTDGSVQVSFESGWREGEVTYESGTLDDVAAGEVDMAWVGARVLDRRGVTSFRPLLAPMLVDSHDLQRAVFEEGIPEEMLAAVEELDLVGVGVMPGPMFKLLGIEAPFMDPADFAGKVVGIQDSALAEETFRTLGATTQVLPTSASLDGLDAYAQQLDSIAGNGYQSVATAVTGDLNLWPRPLVIVAGRSVYDELDESQQQALHDASRLAMVDALVGSRNADEESAAHLCTTSLTFPSAGSEGLTALRQALEPVYASLREDPATAEQLRRIEALKASVGAPPETVECGGGAEPSGAIPNGTYRHEVTAADVEAVCAEGEPGRDDLLATMPAEGLVFEMTVTGDRVVQSQYPTGRPERAEVGWTGTYRAHRDSVELIETGLTESAPLTFSLEGDELELSDFPFDDCVGELVWVAHPWMKVD